MGHRNWYLKSRVKLKQKSEPEITIFVYNGGGTLVAEYSTQLANTPQVSYLTQDHLGSARVITNQNGQVTTRKDYAAFGEELATSQRTTNLNYDSSETRKGYTGYEKDTESGLEFAQARYYNTTHGRYTSVDPLMASANVKNPQTFNRYSYVLNSPYKFTDPLGLISVTTGACGSSCPNSGGGADGSAFRGTDTTFEHLKTGNQIARELIDKIVAALGGLGGQFLPPGGLRSQPQNQNQTQAQTTSGQNTDPPGLLMSEWCMIPFSFTEQTEQTEQTKQYADASIAVTFLREEESEVVRLVEVTDTDGNKNLQNVTETVTYRVYLVEFFLTGQNGAIVPNYTSEFSSLFGKEESTMPNGFIFRVDANQRGSDSVRINIKVNMEGKPPLKFTFRLLQQDGFLTNYPITPSVIELPN